MCWYWPLVMSRSTQPTEALLMATTTSCGEREPTSGAGISSSDRCFSMASGGDSANWETTTRWPAGSDGGLMRRLLARAQENGQRGGSSCTKRHMGEAGDSAPKAGTAG